MASEGAPPPPPGEGEGPEEEEIVFFTHSTSSEEEHQKQAQQEPQVVDDSESTAVDSEPSIIPTKSTTTAAPWANEAGGAETSQPESHQQAKSFAEIMAEQTEDRDAARAAFETGASLVDAEAEQEAAFRAFQQNQGSQESQTHAETHEQPPPNPEDMTEEEMLAMVMRQSLEEYEEQNKASAAGESSTTDTVDQQQIQIDVIPEEDQPEEDLPQRRRPKVAARSISPVPRTSSSGRPRLGSTRSSSRSISPKDHSPLRRTPMGARPMLGDKEFSQRHLKAIEKTAIEIDSPHVDRSPISRNSRKSISAPRGGGRQPAAIGRQPASAATRRPSAGVRRSKSSIDEQDLTGATAACRRAMMMEKAGQHLSLREIHEIDRALQEAEEAESIQPERFDFSTQTQSSYQPSGPMRGRRSSTRSLSTPRLNTTMEHHQSTTTTNTGTSASPSYLDMPAIQRSPQRNESNISAEEAASIEAALREADAIEAALQEADAKAEMESMMLAQQMQIEAFIAANNEHRQSQTQQGNVRSMTRAQLEYESQRISNAYRGDNRQRIGAMHTSAPPQLHPLEVEPALRSLFPGSNPQEQRRRPLQHPLQEEEGFEEGAGFRMNSSTPSQWNRRDRNTIVGPNGETRSKHDVEVQGQANAQILGLDADDFGVRAHVGNKAFNSFKKKMKQTIKGVASHGTGRAGSDADATKGKAMDPHVRLQISRAINAGLIDKCNGVVKQGKEAMIYHANEGKDSQGYDVAVKVFKRIQEFRGRADYVDGDPRYAGRAFRKASEREQLEMWTEKEFRNLVRANRAKVPVPVPLHYKENVLFMRFMGTNGWPAPQIREVEMRKGSKKWELLYSQVMESIRRLYKGARLVHGDLSEYNILIAPVYQVENPISSVEDTVNELQAVFIDFGQAVDLRHPEATPLLLRDLERVQSFFTKQGVKTLTVDESLELVTQDLVGDDFDDDLEESVSSLPGGEAGISTCS